MRFMIARDGDNIVCVKEFHDPRDKGEVAHFLAELEIAKLDLLEIWDYYNNPGEDDD